MNIMDGKEYRRLQEDLARHEKLVVESETALHWLRVQFRPRSVLSFLVWEMFAEGRPQTMSLPLVCWASRYMDHLKNSNSELAEALTKATTMESNADRFYQELLKLFHFPIKYQTYATTFPVDCGITMMEENVTIDYDKLYAYLHVQGVIQTKTTIIQCRGKRCCCENE